jgi:hypothetical protein
LPGMKRLLGLVFAVVIVTAAFIYVPMASAATPELVWQVPPPGSEQNSTAAGSLTEPWSVAASPVDGHVFVAEPGNRRISEFTSWGEFVKAWGWGVRTAANELQTCTSETGCREGRGGSGAGEIDRPEANGAIYDAQLGVAVDPEGDVWVSEGFKNQEAGEEDFRVQKFNPAGEFLLMVGREVDQTTGADVCTAASGDVCGLGHAGTGPGEFSFPTNSAEFIEKVPRTDAIDVAEDGTVYVGDVGRIEAFAADGTFKEEIVLQGEMAGHSVRALAVDPTGGFFVSIGGLPDARRIDAAGLEAARFNTVRQISQSLTVDARGLATNNSGDLYVTVGGEEGATPFEVLEFEPNGACVICAEAGFGARANVNGSASELALRGIATNTLEAGSSANGDLYVVGQLNEGVVRGGANNVVAYGPSPRFEPPPLVTPKVRGEFASSVGMRSATVQAEVNAVFNATTTYLLEYGLTDCSGGGCTAQAPLSLGSERNAFTPTRPVSLANLAPGTTYHYRFVAANGPLVAAGPDRTFRTYSGVGNGLPDGRGYEMVSPPSKNNGQVGNAEALQLAPTQATPDGEALTYVSLAAFGQNPQSASGGSQYISRRSPSGWTTENISPPDQEGYIHPPVRGFTEDLRTASMSVGQPPLVPGAPEGVENIYLRDNATGALTLATSQMPVVESGANSYCVVFEGASADYSRVFFGARGALTPDAIVGEGLNLYEWTAAQGLRLVNILPNGKPVASKYGMGFGAGGASGFACEALSGFSVLRGAISEDGSRVYWSRKESAEVGGEASQSLLYLRVNGNETIQLDKLQGGVGPTGNGLFWGASKDGSIAFFTAPGKLTAGAGKKALYRYDLNAEQGKRLVAVTPGPTDDNVLGVLGSSDDGDRVYFAAEGALASGAQVGAPNLYLWEQGAGLRYIATLSTSDGSDWTTEPGHQTARANPDGSALTFLSTSSLSGFDNVDQITGRPDPEAYLFDLNTAQLSCVSCNPTGARPLGPATLPTWPTSLQQPRYLSADGNRMFFMTQDALILQDTNGRQDVYEFERAGIGSCAAALPSYSQAAEGCISLMSTGTDTGAAVFVDASEDGQNIFFGTPQQLVSQDVDGNYDIYDARVGGGIPQAAPPASECSGESCRATVQPPPAASPGSSGEVGPGNAQPKQQPKKKPHKRKQLKKKHKKKAHEKKHRKDGAKQSKHNHTQKGKASR